MTKDSEYQAYVEKSLEQAESERQAGQFTPMRESMEKLKDKFKQDYRL